MLAALALADGQAQIFNPSVDRFFILDDSRRISASSLTPSHDCGHIREIGSLIRCVGQLTLYTRASDSGLSPLAFPVVVQIVVLCGDTDIPKTIRSASTKIPKLRMWCTASQRLFEDGGQTRDMVA